MNVQPTIDALNAEIKALVSARDALQAVQERKPGTVRTITAVAKKKPTMSADEAKRARWAEAKRKSRAAKGGTK